MCVLFSFCVLGLVVMLSFEFRGRLDVGYILLIRIGVIKRCEGV